MTTAASRALRLFGATLLLAVSLLGLTSASSSAPVSAGDELVAAADDLLPPTAAPDRPPRVVRTSGLLAGAAVVLALVLTATGRQAPLLQRQRRQRRHIGDIGDEWRSLLVGAPPALP